MYAGARLVSYVIDIQTRLHKGRGFEAFQTDQIHVHFYNTLYIRTDIPRVWPGVDLPKIRHHIRQGKCPGCTLISWRAVERRARKACELL